MCEKGRGEVKGKKRGVSYLNIKGEKGRGLCERGIQKMERGVC